MNEFPNNKNSLQKCYTCMDFMEKAFSIGNFDL